MRIFFLLFMLLGFFFPVQAESYRIFNNSAHVEVRIDNVWFPAKKRMSLRLFDWVRIPEGETLSILEESTRRIYVAVESGEYRVSQVIQAAKSRADRLISDVNREIKRAIMEQQGTEYSYNTVGVSHRGPSDSNYTKAVYAALKVLDMEDVNLEGGIKQLCLSIHVNEDGSGHFVLANETDNVLYVNIFYRNSITRKGLLCFPVGNSGNDPCVVLAPQTIREMPEYTFEVKEMEGCLFLFGTNEPFDVQMLQLLLEELPAIDSQSTPQIIYSNILRL